jgi:serine/threonine protein kinase
MCGSPLYMAPEILRMQKYTSQADLWSLGAIMYEMLFGFPPFPARSHFELLQLFEKRKIQWPPEITSTLSKECVHLLESLLQIVSVVLHSNFLVLYLFPNTILRRISIFSFTDTNFPGKFSAHYLG